MNTINEQCRDSDLLARLGGEEFAILMTDTQPTKLKPRMEKLLKAIQDCKVDIGGTVLNVTASFGVTISKGKDIEQQINHADELLYEAKEGGRNRAVMQVLPDSPHEVILCPQDNHD